MNKKQLSFGLAGLLVFAWVVLRDVSKTKSWHDFFVAPPPKPCKLLEKAEPLSITKETNQRMKGFGQSKSEKVRFSLFEDMLNNVKKADQEAVSNVKSESPLPEPVKATKKIIVKPERVVQKVNKIVPSPKQEKNYFPVSFERKGRKKALKVKNSFISGHVYGTQELKHGRSIKGISLNPSDYIPSLDCTRALKRDCSFSYFREKSLLGRIDAFTGRSSNFLNVKRSKNLNGLCSDIQRELRRSDQIKIAAKECNNKLIPIYKEQIKNLEAQNRQIDKTLVDPRF
ncbi:hypothetical protein CE557_645 [Cardinium endosymbiont of Sogatella furcifera]|uniref:hypothetical protein n=1 Tax=Cardinium endosymbiont of Sogatella furcifera TaxID=650378 RepID=UPI000E0D32A0|nr:hypothetical protein [Cardinium endosymbiont of Sogatella furcifera]AXI24446.1 hypothetical protein CE557_645 [Cardinium endosymbiont of Sogatella furcifera]